MKHQRVLITGATGFVGLRLHKDLRYIFQVIGTYRGVTPLTQGVDWIEFNAETDSVLEMIDKTHPDFLVHLLALSRTEICAKQPETAKDINTRLTLELGTAAQERGIPFLFTSTDQVFDGMRGGYSEEDPPHPQGVYARTKVDAEAGLGKIFEKTPGLLTILRLALSYGHSDPKHPGPVG